MIRSPDVATAFLGTPRHHFLPGQPLDEVYSDRAIPTKTLSGAPVSSSSQPAIMAVMLEQLQLEPGLRVLEIGAGTGFNAALIAAMVGPSGSVISLDIDQDIVTAAAAHLTAAGVAGVELVCTDGARGWPAGAPYDRIILTVGSPDLFPAWVEQLTPDGLLVLPLALGGGVQVQRSVAFRSAGDHLESVSAEPCGFMPLRGDAERVGAGAAAQVVVQPGVGVHLSRPPDFPAERLRDWLAGPYQEEPAPIQVGPAEAWGGLPIWLALNEPDHVTLSAGGPAGDRADLPAILAGPGFRFSHGIWSARGICFLSRPLADERLLSIRVYGGDEALGGRMKRRLLGWDAAGRPCSRRVSIRAYAAGREPLAVRAGEVLVRKPNCSLLLACE